MMSLYLRRDRDQMGIEAVEQPNERLGSPGLRKEKESAVGLPQRLFRLLRNAIKLGALRGPVYVVQTVLGRLLLSDGRCTGDYGLPGTGEMESLGDLEIESANRTFGHAYVPTPPTAFTVFMRNLPRDLGEFTFVDFGSGKGTVLLMAAEYGFKQIIGVEFAAELHQFSCRNIAEASRTNTLTERITCLHGDACDLQIPEGDCVLYFNNPFAEPVMKRILKHIEAAWVQNPRKIYILYQQLLPELEDDPTNNLALLDARRFLKRRKTHSPSFAYRMRLAAYTLRIYETVKWGKNLDLEESHPNGLGLPQNPWAVRHPK
jgi:SAM-dependent methyltransferase